MKYYYWLIFFALAGTLQNQAMEGREEFKAEERQGLTHQQTLQTYINQTFPTPFELEHIQLSVLQNIPSSVLVGESPRLKPKELLYAASMWPKLEEVIKKIPYSSVKAFYEQKKDPSILERIALFYGDPRAMLEMALYHKTLSDQNDLSLQRMARYATEIVFRTFLHKGICHKEHDEALNLLKTNSLLLWKNYQLDFGEFISFFEKDYIYTHIEEKRMKMVDTASNRVHEKTQQIKKESSTNDPNDRQLHLVAIYGKRLKEIKCEEYKIKIPFSDPYHDTQQPDLFYSENRASQLISHESNREDRLEDFSCIMFPMLFGSWMVERGEVETWNTLRLHLIEKLIQRETQKDISKLWAIQDKLESKMLMTIQPIDEIMHRMDIEIQNSLKASSSKKKTKLSDLLKKILPTDKDIDQYPSRIREFLSVIEHFILHALLKDPNLSAHRVEFMKSFFQNASWVTTSHQPQTLETYQKAFHTGNDFKEWKAFFPFLDMVREKSLKWVTLGLEPNLLNEITRLQEFITALQTPIEIEDDSDEETIDEQQQPIEVLEEKESLQAIAEQQKDRKTYHPSQKKKKTITLEPIEERTERVSVWYKLSQLGLNFSENLNALEQKNIKQLFETVGPRQIERLKGDKSGLWSMRKNQQYRVIFKIVNGQIIVTDHHNKHYKGL